MMQGRFFTRWICLVAWLCALTAQGQRLERLFDYTTSWDGLPTYPSAIEFDRADSILYMGFWPCLINDTFMPGLARWDGVAWEAVPNTMDSLQCATNWITSIVAHEGELFIAGNFDSIGFTGPSSKYLARYGMGAWHACGSPSSWPKIVAANDELWVVGGFDAIGTNGANNLARYLAGDWWPFGSSLANNQVRAVTYHGGSFFAAGNFTQSPVTPMQDILYWDGTAWQQVGEGFGHQNSWVNTMASFQGRLFVGGALFMGDGIPGQHLVVWNGEHWSDFFQDRLLCRNQVNDLQVIDGKLYMAGVFQFAGDAHYYNLLQYDGVDLCAVGKDLTANAGLYAMQVRGNSHEIYFSNGHIEYADDTVNYMAKWVLGLGPDTCVSAPLGFLERSAPDAQLYLNGNPQHDVLSFSVMDGDPLPNSSRATLRALDGRLVDDLPLTQNTEGRYTMDVSAVTIGLYILTIERPGLPLVSRKVVLE